jgi:hypothetical protein
MAGTASGRKAARVQRCGIGPEPVIHREEAVGLMFTVTDILDEVRAIRELLEGDDGEEEEAVPE